MNAPAQKRVRGLKYLTTAILIVGFGTAVAVYFAARARPENPLGYEPLETKQYLHDLELYGGKANVLAAEFRDWFVGLWYGRRLAVTIAVITLVLVAAVRLTFALRAMPRTSSDAEEGAERGGGPSGWGSA